MHAALWLVDIAFTYVGVVVGRGRDRPISPGHFAERYGHVVIVALGESVVALGVAATHAEITPGIAAASVLGIVVIAALWWAYFDVLAVTSHREISRTTGGGAVTARAGLLPLPALADDRRHRPVRPRPPFDDRARRRANRRDLRSSTLRRALAVFLVARSPADPPRLSIRRTTNERLGWIGPGRLAATIAMLLRSPCLRIPGARFTRALRGCVLCSDCVGPRSLRGGTSRCASRTPVARYGDAWIGSDRFRLERAIDRCTRNPSMDENEHQPVGSQCGGGRLGAPVAHQSRSDAVANALRTNATTSRSLRRRDARLRSFPTTA